MDNVPLLHKLLLRGDEVSIQNGRLIVSPRSGNTIPADWFKNNKDELATQIAQLLQLEMFIFDRHTTGNYGARRYSGVTLHFINILTGESAYCVFNADITYKRSSKNNKKGSRLPKGRFSINRNHSLYKFYKSTALPMPRRPSCFHEVINKLKSAVFFGETNHKGKFKNKLLPLVDISYIEIMTAFKIKSLNNESPLTQLNINNKPTVNFNTNSNLTQVLKGLQQNRSTCAKKYDTSIQGSTNKGSSLKAISNANPSCSQVSLRTYQNKMITEGSISSEEKNRRQIQNQTNEEWLNSTGY